MGSDCETVICASQGKILKRETTDYESSRLKIWRKLHEGVLSLCAGSESEMVICAG